MHKKRVKESNRKNRKMTDELQEALGEGFSNTTSKGWIVVLMLCVLAYLCVRFRANLADITGLNKGIFYLMWLTPIIFIMMQKPRGNKTEQDKFESIGLTNALGESPELKSKERDKKNPNIQLLTYDSQSIPITDWHAKKEKIESAFDCTVSNIMEGRNKQEVIISVIESDIRIPDNISWSDDKTPGLGTKTKDEYKSRGKIYDLFHKLNQVKEPEDVLGFDKGFTLNLGESVTGPVLADLNSTPHLLVGGTTGSGKSVELRCLMWQCVLKGAKIFILDFKGGLEFGAPWERYAKVYSTPEEALVLLETLFSEMQARNELFRETTMKLFSAGKRADCKNLLDYNRLNPDKPLARIVLACDEIAQVLMTNKSADKEEKAIYAGINDRIQRLAQLSRASGINMMLATQRPDAKLIDGQIRTNVDLRICGRVSRGSESEIVLNGDPIAATISRVERGRFYANVNGMTRFQGYYFEDGQHINPDGNYQIGETIIDFEKALSQSAESISNETQEEINWDDLEIPAVEEGTDKYQMLNS